MSPDRTALGRLRRFISARAASELPDADLLRRFVAANDPEAFEAVVRRHGGLVLGTCRRQLRHETDVEDCFQATFAVLVRKAPSIRNGESLAGWLYGTAVRVCRHARSRKLPAAAGGLELVPSPPDDAEGRDLARLLDEEVQRLPERYRAPVLLCHFEGHTQEQAARLLGLPVGTVATRVSRGLRQLRERLARRGHDAPALVPPVLTEALVVRAVQAAASEGACRLAAAVLRQWALARLARAAVVVLMLAGVAAGAGVLLHTQPTDPEPPPVAKRLQPPQGWAERARFRVGKADGPVQVMAFSSDGKTLAAVASAGFGGGIPDLETALAIHLFDAPTGRPAGTLFERRQASSNVDGLAFHGGRLLAVERGLYTWDLAAKKSRLLVPRGKELTGLLALDGNTAAVQSATAVHLHDARSGKRTATLPCDPPATEAVFPPGGREVVTLDPQAVTVWDRASGRRLRRTPMPPVANGPWDLSPDGRRVAYVHAAGREVRVWDVAGGKTVTVPGSEGTQLALRFSPDGRLLALARGGAVRLWDLAASRELAAPPGGTDLPIYRLTYSPDGRTLAAGDLGGNVVLWSRR